MLFLQRTLGSSELFRVPKDFRDKTLQTKESMIKDIARELKASIEEVETTSLWPLYAEDIC